MQGGFGIVVDQDSSTSARASAAVTACLVEQNTASGILVDGSDATISTSVIRGTKPYSDGTFGDGIVLIKGEATIEGTLVTENARAGLSNFSGHGIVTGGVFTCNAIDIDGESDDSVPFSFDGTQSTGWQCSARAVADCQTLGSCHVESAGVAAPSLPPLGP
jgi:hypothetical protein